MSSPYLSAQMAKRLANGFRQMTGPWVQDNVAASQSAVALKLAAAANTGVEVAMPRAGSITGIGAAFTVAPAGAACVLDVTKNGTAISGCTISVPAGATLGHQATFVAGLYTFAAGDRIGVKITTTGSWTAITSDLTAQVEIES